MKTKTINCHPVTKIIYEKYFGSLNKVLLFLLFSGLFVQNVNAQSCTGISIKKFDSNSGEIVFSTNLNSSDQAITWTIKQDASAASFTENQVATIKKVSVTGSNDISINVGPGHGSFTVILTFDGADPPGAGSCSGSYSF